MKDDPTELINLAEKFPEKVTDLLNQYQKIINDINLN
jgi:hypothetical protein